MLHLFHLVCCYFKYCLCKEIDTKFALDTFYLMFVLYTSINEANPGRLIHYSIMHTIEKPNRNVFTKVVTEKGNQLLYPTDENKASSKTLSRIYPPSAHTQKRIRSHVLGVILGGSKLHHSCTFCFLQLIECHSMYNTHGEYPRTQFTGPFR